MPFLEFLDSFLKVNKNCDYLANFKKNCRFVFYMGPHYADFTSSAQDRGPENDEPNIG